MKNKFLFTFLILAILMSCTNNNDDIPDQITNNNNNNIDTITNNNEDSASWLIPIKEVKDGGPGKDGIPSIDNPKFVDASNVDFLNFNDLVIGIIDGDEIKAYPHLILDWHEIVNDEINQKFVSISYCPLTGTAFGWRSNSGGKKSTFGVSGLLYNTNLILYDRNTNSNWSQLKLQCVNGPLIKSKPSVVSVVETNWGTWKKLYPNTKVMTLETGFDRDYEFYPYGDYKTNQNLFLFTATPSNNALPNKERVFTIIDGNEAKVYQFNKFNNGNVIKDVFGGVNYLVVGNGSIINAFELTLEYRNLNFEYAFNDSEIFFKDNENNKWSIFGEALEGPRKGQQLNKPKYVVSFWFAIAAFYPNPKIF